MKQFATINPKNTVIFNHDSHIFSICQSGESTPNQNHPKKCHETYKLGGCSRWPVWREDSNQCPAACLEINHKKTKCLQVFSTVTVQVIQDAWELKSCPGFPFKTFVPLPGHSLGRGHDNQGGRAQNRRHIIIKSVIKATSSINSRRRSMAWIFLGFIRLWGQILWHLLRLEKLRWNFPPS